MFEALEDIYKLEEESCTPFWQIVQQDDCRERAVSQEESFETMRKMYLAMKESALNYDSHIRSNSGLVGGEAGQLRNYLDQGNALVGEFTGRVMELALRVAEGNACMKRIVAAPTAGSCGVVPAVFIATQEKLGLSDEKMTEALFVAAGVGAVIARRASLAGAEGGCQAEIGSASSMAAAGLVYLQGGSGRQSANAAALALKNLLGLACDPVAGLVEVPCVKRNVCGAMNAVTSAELTMAGIESRIPADVVFDAMNAIGKSMSSDIKETGNGGVAATPTGVRISKTI
ncbi:MAG: L-serine ammonia-lyase, iron-sulfur-dependent, subunit alpha [Pseudobutyrivibrio sp.]|nr:L-serine ammonia-lyase, iron-sulfur-dependent, subunit alpha [Pseudobutyrivibrio sp.]